MGPATGGQVPFGIVLIALLSLVGSFLVAGGGLVFVSMIQPGLLPGAHTHPARPPLSLGWVVYDAALLTLGPIFFIMGIGLWRLRDWARVGTILTLLLSVCLWLIPAASSERMLVSFLAAVLFPPAAWVLWYLHRPEVKQAFHAAAPGRHWGLLIVLAVVALFALLVFGFIST